MRTPKLVAAGSVGINMTPMIDVTFLLIIFFLVSSHLSRQENSIPLELPMAESGLDETESRQSMVVNVLADGTWMIAGAKVDIAAVDRILRQHQMDSAEPVRLRIRTDQSVAYEKVEPILGVAARLGVGDVVFSVYEDQGQ